LSTKIHVTVLVTAAFAGLCVSFTAQSPARAAPVCTSGNVGTTTCTLDGQTFDPTPSGNITTGANANGLTYIANFTTSNQNPSSVSTPVLDYLALLGVTGASYLGRAGNSNSSTWESGVQGISASNGNGSNGNWSLSLTSGATGTLIGSYVAIHAGNGQSDNLFLIDSPGLSGTYQTNNGKDLSNFDLFGCPATCSGTCNGEVLPHTNTTDPAPEPSTVTLMGLGLGGLALVGRSRRKRGLPVV
jgi:hypothetical protein